MTRKSVRLLLGAVMLAACQPTSPADPLPSWNDGPAKGAIIDFVARVTDESHSDYRPVADRVAVFDNDGTLWAEQPVYFQLAYALDRVRATAPDHPKWLENDALRAVIEDDREAMAGFDTPELMEIIGVTHSGMTTAEFGAAARAWLASARHPLLNRAYRELTYVPMVELLGYLRANGFQTWIVSGGGIEFIRMGAEELYGVPPEQVIGSSTGAKYRSDPTAPDIVKLPELGSLNDGAGKPVNIHLHIGSRPILAFGNSDGDFEMLEYTTSGDGARIGLLLHHDDAEREWAYDRRSHIGKLDRGLDKAAERRWVLVSMTNDFRTVFATR